MIDIYYVKVFVNPMTTLVSNKLAVNGENLATDFLTKIGYRIIARNYHTPYGELDVIAWDGDELVVIEVKTRSSHSLKFAENSITASKQRKISLSALNFIAKYEQYANSSCRFDIIIVFYYSQDDSYEIKHFKDSFKPSFPSEYFS